MIQFDEVGKISVSFKAKTLLFKLPSGTSRGVLTEKKLWILKLNSTKNKIQGWGECSVIPGLSPDYSTDLQYEAKLLEVCQNAELFLKSPELLINYPSILFGLESAFLDWKNGGERLYFDSDFSRGNSKIPINGLVWMGSESFMRSQIEEKITAGFRCIKMKVGAINFEEEIQLISEIRKQFSPDQLELRVDANGAFEMEDALNKLTILNEFKIHSIEQPINAGNWSDMKKLCSTSPLPIALDEELIGINTKERKLELLETIRPQYIILKPSLHGGFSGSTEWIELAQSLEIPWWITSALESNIGLSAIAQFAGTFSNPLPQGLGTGSLFQTNFDTNLEVEAGFIRMKK